MKGQTLVQGSHCTYSCVFISVNNDGFGALSNLVIAAYAAFSHSLRNSYILDIFVCKVVSIVINVRNWSVSLSDVLRASPVLVHSLIVNGRSYKLFGPSHRLERLSPELMAAIVE